LLERGRIETVDAEIADPGLGAAVDDQFRHDGAGAGTELEAMQRKAELMIGIGICDPFTAQEFATRGIVVRPFVPRIDFEFAAVFPVQRSPSPVALDLVETVRRTLQKLDGSPSSPIIGVSGESEIAR
jgi:hypothetical protein